MDKLVGFTTISNRTAFSYDEKASAAMNGDYWRVCFSFRYYVGFYGSNEWVDVEKGFLTNGADVPRIIWAILPRNGEYDQAVALHDKLCEKPVLMTPTGPKVISRKRVNEIFYEALGVLQVASWKLTIIKGGVEIHRYLQGNEFKPPHATKVHLQSDPIIIKEFFDGFSVRTNR